MKNLARFILSMQKMVENPVSWFDSRSWLVRMLLVISLVPTIGVVSIFGYQKLLPKFGVAPQLETPTQQAIVEMQNELKKQSEINAKELSQLRENIAELNRKLIVTSMIDDENIDPILGAQDVENVNANLRDRLQEYLDGTDLDSNNNQASSSAFVYVDPDKNPVAFSKPSRNSQEVDLEPGLFYPALLGEDAWQQIDIGRGQNAWIEKKYIIVFPVNDNY